jgi:HSF-type DNA-binding
LLCWCRFDYCDGVVFDVTLMPCLMPRANRNNYSSPFVNRTEDGEMFVIKDPETFATQVIPQYFDHNKFSSFARQVRHTCVTLRASDFVTRS